MNAGSQPAPTEGDAHASFACSDTKIGKESKIKKERDKKAFLDKN